jgi:ABC-type lipoprotein release transport system permease subunit
MVALRIALRYLSSKKSHSAVNVISIISIVGVALASMAIVCILSVFNGFSDLALKQASAPDLRVSPLSGKVIEHADSLVNTLNNIDGVALAAPVLEERALAVCGDKQMPVRIKGVSERYSEMTKIDSIVKIDGMFALHDSVLGDVVTLSVGAAISLEARPTLLSRVQLYVPRRVGRINTANPATSFRSDTLTVGGVYQTERSEEDSEGIIIPIYIAKHLLDYDDEASAIEIKVTDGSKVDEVARRVVSAVGSDFSVKNRLAQQADSLMMIAVEKWITFCMLAFILIIASFNVVSTLCMLIIEKDSNIHTMFAIGASRGMIARVFMIEGWLISLVGGVIGIIVGAALCLIQQIFGLIQLGGNHDVMTTDVYPVRLDCVDLLIVVALVAVVGVATSLLTAIIAHGRFSLTKQTTQRLSND